MWIGSGSVGLGLVDCCLYDAFTPVILEVGCLVMFGEWVPLYTYVWCSLVEAVEVHRAGWTRWRAYAMW